MLKTALTNVTLSEAGGLSILGMCIVFAVLIALMVVLAILTRIFSKENNKPIQDATQATAATANPAPSTSYTQAGNANNELAPGSVGEIKLNNVPDKQAAMVMAIVADHLKVPLNQLRFKSIKRID